MLADTTAVYALGHFFVTSKSSEHELMVLWAPLLLVHLGGQDNITAYAVEDNRLWLRHLQNFGVQVAAAAYVLYQSSILSRPIWLRASTMLIFLVGVLKYGERVWALNRASGVDSSEVLWLDQDALKDTEYDLNASSRVEHMYHAIQMHLSQMYNVFYSKAMVMCTWQGICIRVISPLATIASFLVFRILSDKDGYNSVDVTATYILLVGAGVLEITSVVRLIFSTWGMRSLRRWRWGWCMWLVRQLVSLHQLTYWLMQKAGMHTMYWSGTMEQLNLLYLHGRKRDSLRSKISRWMGRWGRWIRIDFSWSIPVPIEIIQMVMETMDEVVHQNLERDTGFYEDPMQHRMRHRPGFYEEPMQQRMQRFSGFERELHRLLEVLEQTGNMNEADIVKGLTTMVTSRAHESELRFLRIGLQTEIGNLVRKRKLADKRLWGWDQRQQIEIELQKMVNRRINDQSELRFLGRIRSMGFENELDGLVSGDDNLEESILVWHIATHVYVKWHEKVHPGDQEIGLAKATEALSNYMIFLLAAHPLRPTASPSHRPCSLNDVVNYVEPIPADESVMKRIQDHGLELNSSSLIKANRVEYFNDLPEVERTFARGLQIGEMMISKGVGDGLIQAIAHLWVHLLYKAEDKLGEDFHVKQLSNGGEFLTVLSVLVKYKPPTTDSDVEYV
ncbi:hypothetical protein ACQ4PT_020182 [Festuca glaucescens]